MEYKVLNPQEKSLVLDLCKFDCHYLTINDFNTYDIKNHKDIIIGCFDSDLIGCLILSELSSIDFIIIDKNYHLKDVLLNLFEIVKKVCINKLVIAVHPIYKQYLLDLDFTLIGENESLQFIYNKNILAEFSTYDDVYSFITSQKDRVYSLDNFREFMKTLFDVQNHLSCVHIGGTNGKGSTTNYVRSVLQKEGYKVATFTSPALVSRLDVIRINNEPILEEDYVKYANNYIDLFSQYKLSMFEIEVFIALMYYIENNVDIAVFEVGLGGEFDATNIITPLISAITNIGLDHVEYLGHTYESIAKTKAGIIKKDKAFVTTEDKKECLDMFEDVCHKRNVQYFYPKQISNIKENDKFIEYDYKNYHIQINTPAIYQVKNSVLAIEILSYLRDYCYMHLSDEALLEGLKEALWQGRFEVLNNEPLIIVDGAHNKEGIEAFYNSAKKFKNIKIIFSALKDKDTHAMIEKLLSLTEDVTICEFDFYRAQNAETLAEDFFVNIEKDWKKAVDDAFLHDGVTFITGSLYFISQVRLYILNKQKS